MDSNTPSASWRKSTYSNGAGECVEVGQADGVAVRDTTDNGIGPVLRLTAADWRRLTATIRNG